MNDYLTKPINPALLQQALMKALPAADRRGNHCDAGGTVLFDEAALLARTDNDSEFARELINLFIGSASETLARLSAYMPAGEDPEVIRKLAHSLKGSAATAAAKALAVCAANLERVAGSAQAAAALESLGVMLNLTIDEWSRLGWIARKNPDALAS
jgi:HPt (histidine-containing phosphotransfer) domain-containing protein